MWTLRSPEIASSLNQSNTDDNTCLKSGGSDKLERMILVDEQRTGMHPFSLDNVTAKFDLAPFKSTSTAYSHHLTHR
jgi:hypothetical protein